MDTIKEYKATYDELIEYNNFSEEVVIISETQTGEHLSVYTVKNKNDVTFQNVPGTPGIENSGKMGYINGDRARPIMLGGQPVTDKIESTTDHPGDPIDITQYQWDIQLEVESAVVCGNSDTTTKTKYISVT